MATYYISPDGSDTTGNGAYDTPYKTVTQAITNGGGNTYILKDGIYPTIYIDTDISIASNAIIVKAENKWKAIVANSNTHGVYNNAASQYITFDGLRVYGALLDGIKLQAANCTVKNCWVHNNTQNGISSHSMSNNIVENNIVEKNGVHVNYHQGLYIDGDSPIIRNNIVRNNIGHGIQLFSYIINSSIYNNLIYGHRYKVGLLITGAATTGLGNKIYNNTISNNGIGISNAGCDNIFANNILTNNTTPNSSVTTLQTYLGTGTTSVNALGYNNIFFAPTYTTLSIPTNGWIASSNVYSNPLFVNTNTGAYFLATTSSPAIAAGTPSYFPTLTFWGGSTASITPYIGAFPYVSTITATSDPYFASWYNGYSYNAPEASYSVPDFWNL